MGWSAQEQANLLEKIVGAAREQANLLAQCEAEKERLQGATQKQERNVWVKLEVNKFDEHALRLLKKERVQWEEYVKFMRRCGFKPSRNNKFGFPRVCVMPYDDPPLLLDDCLGMTSAPNSQRDVELLYKAHIKRIVHWFVEENIAMKELQVSGKFYARNMKHDGFFVMVATDK